MYILELPFYCTYEWGKNPLLKTFQIIIISRLDFDKSKEKPPANVEQVHESFKYLLHNYYLTRTTFYIFV